jgi:hypothetical protein
LEGCSPSFGVFVKLIAKARLVGEKSYEGITEVLLVSGIVGLIDSFDKHLDRFGVYHINVAALHRMHTYVCLVVDEDTPNSIGNVPIDEAVFVIYEVIKANSLKLADLRFVWIELIGICSHKKLIGVIARENYRAALHRPRNVNMMFN